MILVIGNIAIEAAPALVNTFPAGAASLVTASDIFRSFQSGLSVNDFSSSRLLIGNQKISPNDISGVINTVPRFFPVEFYYVPPEDREYVCMETNAFFQYLLYELKCTKCNPPDTRTLIGWNVIKLEWIKIASRLGIPLLPFHLLNGQLNAVDDSYQHHPINSTVIFDEVIDASLPDNIRKHSHALAVALSLPYLDCCFIQNGNNYFLSHINTIPDIASSQKRKIISDHFIRQLA